ncbi:sugar transferase [Fulvivirga sediminis]|uniref:Sugar transferase n=1 Tax=Fulvivirga sediminis TaxID=2803949 RepID=A0A937F844_9BACT|nr:sugar transferase [Fulvivirga sediminis]MBL3658202.1 sugar transferase [Fulvivirga sediminis]
MSENRVMDFQASTNNNLSHEINASNKAKILFIGAWDDLCLDLRLEGYPIDNMESSMEAYNWLKNSTPDQLPSVLIVNSNIDIQTLEPFEQIKSTVLKDVPMIFLAERFDESERDQAIKIGAEDYYTDNISAKELSHRIDFLSRLKELSQESTHEVGREQIPLLHNNDTFKMWSMKRAFDIAISGTALLLISPVLLIIAIAIKLDSKGPIFYISKRAGKGYQIFNFYKFRSMRQDADHLVQEMMHLNQYAAASDNGGVFFKVKNDPRITKLGGFLRRTSLDEIPQLINVLKGDMSLVGNRPLPLYEAEKLTQDQWALRFLAPAGITGLWQITKRGKEDMSEEERVSLDMEYANKNSFWYDLKIMLKTPAALLQKENV